ncbi:hypothetical protein IFM89_032379 [Coptis chinensis]|uniref:Uncharacterized protein n=1 Tax=Coptis chinensis TaxID=261450 RepID=A0A835HZ95_9MAGN|nr:hypothetical protein IFM89_032379 [Coptis chinensis]
MKEVELALNQTQKIRLQKAFQHIQHLSSKTNSSASVIVTDTIPVNLEDGVLKGHGTNELDGEVVATLCGVVERVNKLVYVKTFRARYKPETGDIVVGRVVEVAPKRWRIEINFSQDAVLMLSSMNMPDGIQGMLVPGEETMGSQSKASRSPAGLPPPHPPNLLLFSFVNKLKWLSFTLLSSFTHHIEPNQEAFLSPLSVCKGGRRGWAVVLWVMVVLALWKSVERRRTALDELNMRGIFEENDVICAEVRGLQHDGCLHLQARSQKYGKLERGQLVMIPPYLVKRRKQHFHHLEQYGIDMILGCNGYIWVGEHVEVRDVMVEDQETKSDNTKNSSDLELTSIEEQERTYTPLGTRQMICRLTNAVRVLSSLGFNLTVELIIDTVDLSISLNLDIHEMLGTEFYVRTAEREVERRSSSAKKK